MSVPNRKINPDTLSLRICVSKPLQYISMQCFPRQILRYRCVTGYEMVGYEYAFVSLLFIEPDQIRGADFPHRLISDV